MDQDANWYGGMLGPGDIVLYGGPSSAKRGHSPHLSAYVCCGQTAAWIKVSRGKKVVLGPGHIVLNGDSAPLPQKVNSPLQFSALV